MLFLKSIVIKLTALFETIKTFNKNY